MAEEAYEKCEKTQGNGTWVGESLHLSNARKDILELRFSEMGLGSAPAPNAIVADQMEVEI